MIRSKCYHGKFKPKKTLGQNFLTDSIVIEKIINQINLQPEQTVIEIGPGLAAITNHMITGCRQLIAIEIDAELCVYLQEMFKAEISAKKLIIINQDALQTDFSSLIRQHNHTTNSVPTNVRIVGNLPYYIATQLLFKLLQAKLPVQDLHFLLQKEVADRLIATPDNNKKYGKLSIMAQYHAQITTIFHVAAHAFNPQPKVDSCLVKLIPYSILPYKSTNYSHFASLVTAAFAQRRKIIINSLKNHCTASDLETLGINPNIRAETLNIAEFVKLSNYLVAIN